MPKETHSHNADPVLPFIVPFDPEAPEIDDDERKAVSEKFANLVSNTFLTHVGSSVHDRVTLQKVDDEQENVAWSLSVSMSRAEDEGLDEEEDPVTVQEIAIQRLDILPSTGTGDNRFDDAEETANGSEDLHDLHAIHNMRAGKITIYKLDEDGVVGRFDRGDPTQDTPFTADEIQNGPSPDRKPQYHSISLTEMEGLEAFVSQSGWRMSGPFALGARTLIAMRESERAPHFPPEDL